VDDVSNNTLAGVGKPATTSSCPALYQFQTTWRHHMRTLPASQSASTTRRRLGRPPSKILKVAVSVRIPADVDAFLNDYSDEHCMPKGDIIAEAVTFFRVKKDSNIRARAFGA
jgi:hypothetical protein